MESLTQIQNLFYRQHCSVYEGDTYCGETFYDEDDRGYAMEVNREEWLKSK